MRRRRERLCSKCGMPMRVVNITRTPIGNIRDRTINAIEVHYGCEKCDGTCKPVGGQEDARESG